MPWSQRLRHARQQGFEVRFAVSPSRTTHTKKKAHTPETRRLSLGKLRPQPPLHSVLSLPCVLPIHLRLSAEAERCELSAGVVIIIPLLSADPLSHQLSVHPTKVSPATLSRRRREKARGAIVSSFLRSFVRLVPWFRFFGGQLGLELPLHVRVDSYRTFHTCARVRVFPGRSQSCMLFPFG